MAQLSGPRNIYNIDTLRIDTSQVNPLGAVGYDINGWEWVYAQGTASVEQGVWVVLDENFSSTLLQANEVGPVAVAATAVVVEEYAWFQRTGVVLANTDTINADSSLYIDGTAGRVDDLSVSGDLVIGAYSMTDAVSNKATCYISYPHVSNDLGGGAGGINGPASSTDNAAARWDGTGGDTIQNSGVIIDDSNNVSGIGSATVQTLTAGTAFITSGKITGIIDLLVADGGTGASVAADARTNLGLVIGTNVQAWDKDLDDIAGIGTAKANIIVATGTAWAKISVGSNAQVLTADSAEALGVKWAAASQAGTTNIFSQYINAGQGAIPNVNGAVLGKFGTTYIVNTLDYDPSSKTKASFYTNIPENITIGSATVDLYWFVDVDSAAGSGVAWNIEIRSADHDEVFDSTATPASATTIVISTATADSDLLVATTNPPETGWAAGDLLLINIERDPANAQDILNGTAKLIGFRIRMK